MASLTLGRASENDVVGEPPPAYGDVIHMVSVAERGMQRARASQDVDLETRDTGLGPRNLGHQAVFLIDVEMLYSSLWTRANGADVFGRIAVVYRLWVLDPVSTRKVLRRGHTCVSMRELWNVFQGAPEVCPDEVRHHARRVDRVARDCFDREYGPCTTDRGLEYVCHQSLARMYEDPPRYFK